MKISNICRVVALAMTATGSMAVQAQTGGENWIPPYITAEGGTNSGFHTFELTNNFLVIEGVVSLDYAKAWLMRWKTIQYDIHLAPRSDATEVDGSDGGCLADNNVSNPNMIKMDMYDKDTLAMITGGVTAAALPDDPANTVDHIFINQQPNSDVFNTHYMAADNPASLSRTVTDTNTSVYWGINGYKDGSTIVEAPDFTAGYTGNAGTGVNSDSTWTFVASDVSGSYDTGGTTTICDVIVPVTLSYAYLSQTGSNAKFSWATQDETNNLGFHLWAKIDGSWQLLNQKVLETAERDSLETNRYTWSTSVEGDITEFGLSQVDVDGAESFYGPYKPGVRYGSAASNKVIDWSGIRAELDAEMVSQGFEPVAGGYLRTAIDSDEDVVITAMADADENDPTPNNLLEDVQNDVAIGLVANVRVNKTGIVRVGMSELAAMDIDLSLVPSDSIAVLNRGNPVARHIGTDLNGDRFVEFYAEEVDGIALQSTRENVYQISVESEYVKEAVELAAVTDASGSFVARSKVEEDKGWSFSHAPKHDQWFMGYAAQSQYVSGSTGELVVNDRPMSINNLSVSNVGEGYAVLSIEVINAFDTTAGAEADYVISVNGNAVGRGIVDGNDSRVLRAVVNTSALQNGDNSVELKLDNRDGVASSRVYVDNVSIQYPTQADATGDLFVAVGKGSDDGYRVSGLSEEASLSAYAFNSTTGDLYKLATVRNSDGEVIVPSAGNNPRQMANYWIGSAENLTARSIEMIKPDTTTDIGDANYIVISHENFSDTIRNEYVAWKEGQSYFDADGNEQSYSVAVVDLKDVYDYYGGGLVDASGIRNFLTTTGADAEHVMLVGNASIDYGRNGDIYNFIPTYYERATADQLSPNDGWLVDADLDRVPDTAIGRLPVRTEADLSAVLEKTKNYAQRTDTGLALVYDDLDDPLYKFYAKSATNDVFHHEDNYSEYGSAEIGNYAVQVGIRDSFNDNVATMITQTHGSIYNWGGGNQNNYTFLDYQKSQELTDDGEGTLVYAMTCYTTFFPSTRDESMTNILINDRSGAVAMMGSSVISMVENNMEYTNRTLSLTQKERKTIGQALKQARYETRTNPDKVISSISWNLLGDPTVRSTLDNLRNNL